MTSFDKYKRKMYKQQFPFQKTQKENKTKQNKL
jgi:hypothetical protein